MCHVVHTGDPMVRVDLAENGRKKFNEVTVTRRRVVFWVGCGRRINARELPEDTGAIQGQVASRAALEVPAPNSGGRPVPSYFQASRCRSRERLSCLRSLSSSRGSVSRLVDINGPMNTT